MIGTLQTQEGDTLSVYVDQKEVPTLRYAVNGKMVDASRFIKGMKGDNRPAVSIEGNAIVKFRFDEHSFKFKQASDKKFDAIIAARTIV